MAFCFTFIWDEDRSASVERDWETFISLDGRDAVSGPYRDCTPVTRRRVQIDSSSPRRMPAGDFHSDADLGPALTESRKYEDYFDTTEVLNTISIFSITLKISRHLLVSWTRRRLLVL